MKKLFSLLVILLVSLALLCGCDAKTDANNGEAAPTLYYNLDKGAELTADASGAYTFRFYADNEEKAYQVTDQALAEALRYQDFVGLQLDGNTVTGITLMADMPYQRIVWEAYVQSIGGNNYKLNSYETYLGTEVMLKLEEDFPIYDFSELAKVTGATTELQRNDQVTVIGDLEGTPLFAYVVGRASTLGEGTHLCQHCEKEVQWYEWYSTNSLPIGTGHYMLMDDVNLTSSAKLSSGQLCLDLNGKTVTQTMSANRIFYALGTGTLSIMDSVGTAKLIPAGRAPNEAGDFRGMILSCESYEFTTNLYGGILDASNIEAQYGTAINLNQGTFNMYGGEILGGHSYGNGGGAMVITFGTFNMYGGRIAGGSVETTVWGQNKPGGATIRCMGTLNIYDGIIEGGKAATDGGAIHVGFDVAVGSLGKLTMKGGTVIGGNAQKGGAIFITNECTATLSGNVKIYGAESGGNLWIDQDAKVIIGAEGLGEEAQINVSMTNPGTFVIEDPTESDLSKYFISDNASNKIVKNNDGTWGLK